MKTKYIVLAGLCAAVLVTLAVLYAEQRETNSVDGAEFYPGMLERINDVRKIQAANSDATVTLVFSEGDWLLEERGGFKASSDQVKKFLRGFAEMIRLEKKTTDPAKYHKLGVGDPAAGDVSATRVVLFNASDAVIADLVMGNDRSATADADMREVYVRNFDDSQSWLIQSDIRILRSASEWLDQDLMAIHRDRIEQIFIDHPGDDDDALIQRASFKDKDYTIADIPEDMELAFEFQLRDTAVSLTSLDFEDVMPAKGMDFGGEDSIRVTVDTFDGMRVVMSTAEKDGVRWARLKAGESGRHSMKSEEGADNLLDADAVKAEVERLNAFWDGWAYRVRSFKLDNLTRTRGGFLKGKNESSPALRPSSQ